MKTPVANPSSKVIEIDRNEKMGATQITPNTTPVALSPYALGWAKRVFDVGFSLVVLPIALSLLLIVFIIFPFIDGFSILFHHERVGISGKKFFLHKIRTYEKTKQNAAINSMGGDLKVVPVIGNFLRLSRIDELPQIWNILKGDMSWVGPRPEQSQFVEQIIAEYPNYDARHTVKPGITGLAQINNPNATIEDHQEKLIFDLEYTQKASLLLDLKILWRSLVVVLTKK